jgi:DNA-binding HxlR family transcriptional regulator
VADAGGQPLHFREWARALITHTGTYVSENAITRSLPRLKERGLVLAYDEGTRHPSYRPTRLGTQKAAFLAFILDAIENHYNETQEGTERSGDEDKGKDNGGTEDDEN